MADDADLGAGALDPALVNTVKQFEGFVPRSYWDYKQYSNGYGTRAAFPGERIDRDTANSRLQDELWKASRAVDSLGVPMNPGQRNALTSFTYNLGPGWTQGSGLADAVRAGDWDAAKQHLLSYTHAGGQVDPGLVKRRTQEAAMLSGDTSQPQAPTMSNDYLAQALGGGMQPVDQGPMINALRTFAGQPQGGGMSPLERAGIYLMSINNPQALSGLAAGNKDAEARNANALRALGLMMQQRNADRADKRLESQMAPKSIYGTPQDQQGAPAAPIYDGGTSGGSGGAAAPAAPAAAPASNIYGLADLQQIAAGGAQGNAGGQPGSWQDWNPPGDQVAQGGQGYGQGQRLPSQSDFDIAASRMRADIANGMKPEDVLGKIHDQGLRELVKSWGEGGLNPDSTNRQYDPQTKAARSLAAAIYGDKGIEEAWKRTQQENQNYADAMKGNVAGSVASKLNAMDNLHSVLFAGDEKNLGLATLYDKLGNKQLDSAAASYGLRVPQGVPFIGGLGIPGINTHGGKTQDYVPAYESRVANYMADVLKLRLQGNSGGTEAERGGRAVERSADEFLGDVQTGRGPFNKYMQPNEFRNSLISEMGQNIADLKNMRTRAVEGVGGKVDEDGHVTGNKNAQTLAANIDRRISQAQHDLDSWMVAHPEQHPFPSGYSQGRGLAMQPYRFGL